MTDHPSDEDLASELGELREKIRQIENALAETDEKVFVSIASYCDPELPRTLHDCVEKASSPARLRFGICWQYDHRNPIDLDEFKGDRRFRFMEYPIEKSQGGTWARSIAQGLWQDEDYTLQVDSHMKFEPGWDDTLVRMIQRLPAEKPLISVNSPLFWYDDSNRLHRQTAAGIRATSLEHWGGGGWAPWFGWGVRNERSPARNRFISGNFVFTLGRWNVEVPQDPCHYYWGEEFNLTVRSYTHGYDFFLPDEIVVWHLYHRKEPPRRHWEHGQDVVKAKNRVAFERLRWLLYSDDTADHAKLDRYGLGTSRSRRDYEIFAGMDFKRKVAHPDAYTGVCPDPVTIHDERDWEDCLPCDEFKQRQEQKQ